MAPSEQADDGARGAVAGPEVDALFARVLDERDLRAEFQPIVDLGTGHVVALEALARGPEGTSLASPGALFDAARRVGRVAELDWACRAAAFAAVLEADAPPSVSLLVNVDPEAVSVDCPADLVTVVARAESHLRVFVEVNDRALAADPAGVLGAADRARGMGWGIVIDNVGGSPSPVAMLPVVSPDVVKLDLRRLALSPEGAASEIITSVLRHVERTGASLLVEGIETEDDERWAMALGATYGQGHLLGRPGQVGDVAPVARPIPLLPQEPATPSGTPFQLLADHDAVRAGGEHLTRLATVLAHRPPTSGCPSIYLLCVGDGVLPPELAANGLPESAMVFVVFGTDIAAEPAPGVRGVRLPAGDAFTDERFLMVLSDHTPVALVAREASADVYDVVVVHDVGLVNELARSVIRRVPALGRDHTALERVAVEHVPPSEDEVEVAAAGPAARRGWRSWRSGRD